MDHATTQKIVDAVIKTYRVDITERTRKRQHVWARFAYCQEMRKEGYSLHYIGDSIGIDHATVLHGLRKHIILIDNDRPYKLSFNRFLREMGYDVKEEPLPVIQYSDVVTELRKQDILTKGQSALLELIKQVPDEFCEDVFIKLEAIVRMSKSRKLA